MRSSPLRVAVMTTRPGADSLARKGALADEVSMIASDLVRFLPKALNSLAGSCTFETTYVGWVERSETHQNPLRVLSVGYASA